MEALYTTYLMDIDAGGDNSKCPDELKDFLRKAQEEEHIVPAKTPWFHRICASELPIRTKQYCTLDISIEL